MGPRHDGVTAPEVEVTIFLGIDGTGPLARGEYRSEFRNSFVSYIYRNCPAEHKHYIAGPAATMWDLQSGSDMPFIISQGYTFIHLVGDLENQPILLAGYSRGAAGVVAVAQRLAGHGARVRAMMLFDCVPLGRTRRSAHPRHTGPLGDDAIVCEAVSPSMLKVCHEAICLRRCVGKRRVRGEREASVHRKTLTFRAPRSVGTHAPVVH
jgi:hypothetical protein